MAAAPRPNIINLCPQFVYIIDNAQKIETKLDRVTIKKRDWGVEIFSDKIGGAYFDVEKFKLNIDRYAYHDIWRDVTYSSFVEQIVKLMAKLGWKLWYNIKVRDINAERKGSEVYHEDFSTNWDIYLTLRKDYQYDHPPELDCWYVVG